MEQRAALAADDLEIEHVVAVQDPLEVAAALTPARALTLPLGLAGLERLALGTRAQRGAALEARGGAQRLSPEQGRALHAAALRHDGQARRKPAYSPLAPQAGHTFTGAGPPTTTVMPLSADPSRPPCPPPSAPTGSTASR